MTTVGVSYELVCLHVGSPHSGHMWMLTSRTNMVEKCWTRTQYSDMQHRVYLLYTVGP